MTSVRPVPPGTITALRDLRGRGEHELVLENCEDALRCAPGGIYPVTTDSIWHELAVHHAWATAQDPTSSGYEYAEQLLNYAISNTPAGVLTLPYAMAVCDLVMLHHQRGGIGRKDHELLVALLERMQELPTGDDLARQASHLMGDVMVALGARLAPPDPYAAT